MRFIRTVCSFHTYTFQALSQDFKYLKYMGESMMNDELLKNFSISCNHAYGTFFSYELSPKKYCEYFGMILKEILDEAEKMKTMGKMETQLKSEIS